jgi:NADH-quinone oxidoreductase subunit L
MNFKIITIILLLFPLLNLIIIPILPNSYSIISIFSIITFLVEGIIYIFFVKNWNKLPFLIISHSWIFFKKLYLKFELLFDEKSLIFIGTLIIINLIVQLYSSKYMKNRDSNPKKFFIMLSISFFSIFGISISKNLITLFIFWELASLSSYILISHDNSFKSSKASKQSIIINQISDIGLLIGIILIIIRQYQSKIFFKYNISAIIPVFILMGFIGKSSQIPLNIWIPKAMIGPTPISALIHSSTMVAAGIFFLCKFDLLFTNFSKSIIFIIGLFSNFYGGFYAIKQNNIKRILAYSTISQLGFMAVSFSYNYPYLTLFYLITHAFSKSLIFLSGGIIISIINKEKNNFFILTIISFLISILSLIGSKFFAVYYSKEYILKSIFFESRILSLVITFSSFFTLIYLGKLLNLVINFLLIFAKKNDPDLIKKEKYIPIIEISLIILNCIVILLGNQNFLNLFKNVFYMIFQSLIFLKRDIKNIEIFYKFKNILLIQWIIGIIITFFIYLWRINKNIFIRNLFLNKSTKTLTFKTLDRKLEKLNKVCFFNKTYQFYLKTQKKISNIISLLDLLIISGLISRGFGELIKFFGKYLSNIQNIITFQFETKRYFFGIFIILTLFIFYQK